MKDMHWHQSLPALYNAEMEVLKNGLPYFKFIEQVHLDKTGDLLQINGELSLSENRKQLIQIVFPAAYPYTPPEVFPLNGVLTVNGLKINQVVTPVGIKVTVSFGKGNQYANDKICLFRDEEEWVPFVHGVAMALKQAKRWFETALSPEGFTKDLIVEEDNPIVPHVGQVLNFLPLELPNGNEGILMLKSFKENYYSLIEMTFQENEKVITINTFPDNTILSPTRQEIIFGRWFKVDGDPKKVLPIMASHPTNFNGFLVKLGIALDDLLPDPQITAKRTVVGFRFGKGDEIHFFQLHYWKEGLASKFQSAYLLPKNLSKELFARIDTLFDLGILSGKRVLIVGEGSIGSEVTSELASSGVGYFSLIDEKKFGAGNSVRHAADLLSIGENKVDVVKKIIQAKNPKAKVKTFPASIFNLPQGDVDALIEESDIILDLTANKLVEGYLHQKVCVEKRKTLIQAAVSKGGLTGIVLVMSPGKSPCLHCLSTMKLNYVPISNSDVSFLKNAPADYGACSQPALPGSGLDTKEVAIQTARVALQVLLQNENSFYPKLAGYQYYWHGPAGTAGKNLFNWEINSVEPLPSCELCNRENDQKDSFDAESSEELNNRDR